LVGGGSSEGGDGDEEEEEGERDVEGRSQRDDMSVVRFLRELRGPDT
jgi:hypothetical protein